MKKEVSAAPLTCYRRGSAAHFVDEWEAGGRVGFSLKAISEETGLRSTVAAAQIKRLRPRVVPLYSRANFYLIVAPQARRNGAPPPEWWLDSFFQHIGQPYYLGLLSAAAHWGSSHQAVQITQVITSAPRPSIQIGRIRIRFYAKKYARNTPKTQPRGLYNQLRVSSPEATVLDLIGYSNSIGGFARAIEVIQEIQPKLTRIGMVAAARQSGLRTMHLQRAGYILERLGSQSIWRPIETELANRRLQPARLDELSGSPIEKNRWQVTGKWPAPASS
jgi:hypothetical protein